MIHPKRDSLVSESFSENVDHKSSAVEDLQDRFSRFASKTSIHLVSDIYNSQTWCLKIFWTLILLVVLVMASLMIAFEIIRFVESTVEVSVTTVDLKSFALPRLAICYADSGMNKTKMRNDGVPESIIYELDHNPLTSPRPYDQAIEQEFQGYLKSAGLKTFNDFLRRYIYSCQETIVLDKRYYWLEGNICENARIMHHLYYYNCWMLTLPNQTMPGFIGGLLISITEPAEPTSGSGNAGFAIEVFREEWPVKFEPTIFNHGIKIHMSVSMERQERLKRLSWPKTSERCKDPPKEGGNCFNDCYAMATIESCKCILPGTQDALRSVVPVCSHFTALNCSYQIPGEMYEPCQAQCPSVCSRNVFRLTITTIQINSTSSGGRLVSELYIGYPEMSYRMISEIEAYPLTNLVSNVGGQLGLWLGCSVGTIIQAFILCTIAYGKKRR